MTAVAIRFGVRYNTGMSPVHPALRFKAPSTIEAGVPLKTMVGREMVDLIAESFVPLLASFDVKRFIKQAMTGLEPLGLMPRAAHVGAALAAQLPDDFDLAAPILIASLGPVLPACEGNGLKPFFYLPHTYVIATRGVSRLASGMNACHAITQRCTAEFCIRPLIEQHQTAAIKLLMKWTRDPSPHVRRLVSEGTRPRLPWAGRLKALQADPTLAIPLLERLKDDRELYVRRSVANHLADMLKDHPDFAYTTAERWLSEVSGKNVDETMRAHRLWMIRHAVRLPAKKSDVLALDLRRRAAC